MAGPVTQRISADYIDKKFMTEWLKSTFGGGNFTAEMQHGYYKVKTPRKITEAELDYIKEHKHYFSNFQETSSHT
ncbi:hypothetical protein MAPG_04132 [Magnaporthiopsis poae ATCC 64411]|uniref:Uncharacterized protein n=1 Tax=Magnaporthiopsis poae (strain ATCC 64411 / 73-15) TaxID=644358 RepID=A0A0C4DVW9_MAGP6|nr:hypothetical protein MAPG_04132 [Magnaporthiopsis poae ATCC 64411]